MSAAAREEGRSSTRLGAPTSASGTPRATGHPRELDPLQTVAKMGPTGCTYPVSRGMTRHRLPIWFPGTPVQLRPVTYPACVAIVTKLQAARAEPGIFPILTVYYGLMWRRASKRVLGHRCLWPVIIA